MPIFNVTLAREVIEEITVVVEAESVEDLKGPTPNAFYEQVASKKKLSDWKSTVNDVWLQEEKPSRKKQPELVVQRNKEGRFEVKPSVDVRQVLMFKEEESNA